MATYFKVIPTISDNKKFMIGTTNELMVATGKMPSGNSSGNVLPSRLLGLEYSEYLRMCRDIYSATLDGKKGYISYPIFADEADAKRLCRVLNDRMNFITKGRDCH